MYVGIIHCYEIEIINIQITYSQNNLNYQLCYILNGLIFLLNSMLCYALQIEILSHKYIFLILYDHRMFHLKLKLAFSNL